MPQKPCPYFTFRVDYLILPEHTHPLRLPIYQCGLADTLRSRLRSLPDGDALADALEQSASDGSRYSQYGPDIEPLSIPDCTKERCTASCQPVFVDLMTDLGLDPTLPDSS